MDDLDRVFHRLVSNIRHKHPEYLTLPFTVQELYETLIPYRHHRRELGIETNQDYEIAVTRLLSGERDYLQADPEMRDRLKAELQSSHLDPGAFREFAMSRVSLAPEALRRIKALTVAPLEEPQDPRTPAGAGSAAPAAARAESATAPRGAAGGAAGAPGGTAQAGAATSSDTRSRENGGDAGARTGQQSAPGITATFPLSAPPPPQSPETPPPPASEAAPAALSSLLGASVAEGCPFCGGTLPEGRSVVYCPHCGNNLSVSRCPACGGEVEKGWKYCPTCGRGVG